MNKLFLIAFVVLAGSSCATVTTQTTGDLVITRAPNVAPEHYTIEVIESHETTGLMVGCILTGIFYGGACWAYLATPFTDHREAAERHAVAEGARIGTCAEVVVTKVERAGWNGPTTRQVTVRDQETVSISTGSNLCAAPAPDDGAGGQPSTTPAALPPRGLSIAAEKDLWARCNRVLTETICGQKKSQAPGLGGAIEAMPQATCYADQQKIYDQTPSLEKRRWLIQHGCPRDMVETE